MAKIRTAKSALFRMIQESPVPVYAVTTDMKVVFCNEALCELTGLDDESLTELTCVYQTAADQPPSVQLAAGLCPPPDSFQRPPSEGWVSIPAAGSAQFYQAIFVPNRLPVDGPQESNTGLSDSDAGVLVFVYGPPRSSPVDNSESRVTPDARFLHAALASIQYESAGSMSIDRLAGSSAAANRIRRQVEIAAQSTASVLIRGPRGGGARGIVPLIHFANGPELAGPLIPVHGPASDPESVQETIKQLYRSWQQFPDEPLGRVFLEEVDQLSMAAQIELLGFLNLPDFRLPLIATTSDPHPETRIHPELWQAMTTIQIEIPRLVDRREDIPYLIQATLEQLNDAHHKQIGGIDNDTLKQLVSYSWPGDFDELTDAIDQACRNCTGQRISFDDLPGHIRIALRSASGNDMPGKTTINLDQFLADIELELIQRALSHASGNKSEAARMLGISRPRLLRRLEQIDQDLGTGEDEVREQ